MPTNRKTRVLVVDDEMALAAALRSTLTNEGYDAVAATKPAEALARLREGRFELLLTDLQMPEMDGIALLRAALEIDPRLVGILMTGHGAIDTAVEAMKAGAFDYVVKPFKLRVLLSVLARAGAVRQLRVENDELQRNLTRRTNELEAANRELEAFAYSVSHDLRAPLRTIEGFTEMIEEGIGNEPAEALHGYATRVTAAAQRMSKLIEDLLRLAKISHGELRRERIDLTALATEIVGKLRAEAPTRTVNCEIQPGLVTEADFGLLRIVLENLLSNAWKYTTKTAEPKVEVGETRDADGSVVYFIRDNGAGFDMAQASRLFQPFERLHADKEFAGSGIGLATVHRIIRRHGGDIWASAEAGKGATFSFRLAPPHNG